MATVRSVYQTNEVERKLAKLPEHDHESLRTTYERMLQRGPERFQVKPYGVPQMGGLYQGLPNSQPFLTTSSVMGHSARTVATDSKLPPSCCSAPQA